MKTANLNIYQYFQKQLTDIQCPYCKNRKYILFKDVTLNRIIICPACERKVKLKDKDASASSTRNEIQNIEKEIDKTLKDISNMFK